MRGNIVICPICKGDISDFLKHKIVEELEKSDKSASQLLRTIDITSPTLNKYLSDLIKKGLVIYTLGYSTGGRPAKIYQMKKG